MKNILLILLGFVITFSSCDNEEKDIFDKDTQERIQEQQKEYLDLLTSSEAGWILTAFVDGEPSTATYFVKFGKDGKAIMSSDVDIWGTIDFGGVGSVIDSSLYEVTYREGTALRFTTFSQMNFFSDPNTSKGAGMGGDTDLIIKSTTENTMTCEGKINKGQYIFTKTDNKEYIETLNQIRGIEVAMVNIIYDDLYKFSTVVYDDGVAFDFEIDCLKRKGKISYFGKDKEILQEDVKIYYDVKGVLLQEIITIEGHEFSRLDFNEETYSFDIPGTEGKSGLVIAGAPVVPEIGVADLLLSLRFGPVTGWSSKAKKLRRAMERADERFTSIQMYNTDDIFHGWAFKFSDPSEWPYVAFKDNMIEKLGESEIRFTPGKIFNEKDGTVDLVEFLKIPEAKKMYDILFSPKGFKLHRRIGCQMISNEDPDFWFLVSNGDE